MKKQRLTKSFPLQPHNFESHPIILSGDWFPFNYHFPCGDDDSRTNLESKPGPTGLLHPLALRKASGLHFLQNSEQIIEPLSAQWLSVQQVIRRTIAPRARPASTE
jgi:hypothetical protein